MNRSKGPRRAIKVRLAVDVVEQLERERAARWEAGTLRRVDGIPALVEEAVALRHDRDHELERIRLEVSAMRAERDEGVKTIREQARTIKVLRADNRALGARRKIRAQAALPAPLTPTEAFLRDHAAGAHRDPLVGLCPACGPVAAPTASTGSQGGPPPTPLPLR